MAGEPYDYSSAGFGGFTQGMRFGTGLRQMQQEQAKAAEQEAAQQKFGQDLQAAWQSGDESQLVDLMAANPGQMEAIKGMIGMKDEMKSRAIVGMAGSLATALETGNTTGAAEIIAKNYDLLAGMGQDPKSLLNRVNTDPEGLRKEADSYRLLAMKPEDVIAYRQKLADQDIQRQKMQVQMRGQDISMMGHNIAASNAAQRLAFDQAKFGVEMQQAAQKADELKTAAPKLSVNMEKALDAAVGDAATSRNSAASMEELATRWNTEKPTAGVFGSAQSTWNKMTGSDTGLRDLRIRTSQFLNSQALKYLPPGPATDRDVELAREGVPTNMDDPKLISNWLKAQARNEQRAAAYNDFRAEWISAQGNPGQAKAAGNIAGMDVQQGESFASAAKRYMKQAEPSITGGAGQQQAVATAVSAPSDYRNLWGG